ncbi:hypothetical protein [Paraclostridium sordellii]|uniref:hypothetical protein n=1 Tax=Paraclostridium sordellii TaxID=1505 RepID=UPI0005E45B73|nr:hypothetical protein [Paeniclostridium sordellii]CEP43489.1 Uncharacterised protein [[Clostridium] sordellii] [Paeniclostridium sordellii]
MESYSDNEKGNITEQIATEFFKKGKFEYQRLDTKGIQKYLGDFILLNHSNNPKFVEVKTSHRFRKSGLDKIAFDYLYFKKHSNCRKEYIQKNCDDNRGWLHLSKADYLIAINPISKKLYLIQGYKTIKQNVIEHTDNYIKDISPSIWYHRNYNNNIHRFLEGGVKHDSCKESLIVNLTLNRRSIEELGGTLIECDIIITENRNLDRKKPSDNLEVAEGF